MRRIGLSGLALALMMTSALAGSGTITVKDSTGATQTFDVTTDGSGNYVAKSVTCDGSAAANCAAVKAASTAAVATDPAFVVAVSPNNSVAVTNGGTFAAQLTGSTNNINNIGGTVSLPTGAATSALQTTGNASLATIATNTGAAIPAGTNVIGFISNDPCNQATKLGAAINLTASGQVITGVASKKTYICGINLITATAQNIALVEGTGSTCATNTFGLAGGTTAATGWNFVAGGGLAPGDGNGTVISPSADSNATAANVCLLLSSTGQTSGSISYVQQ